MPATYAHYRFGCDVLAQLPTVMQKQIEEYRALFDIGLHGPDILFYHKPFSKNEVKSLGYTLHDCTGKTFFSNALAAQKTAENPKAANAYLYGMMCHYLLDSMCHPFVEQAMQTTHKTHTYLETQLERFFLLRDGKNPLRQSVTKHVACTLENAAVIAPFFENVQPAQVKLALKTMVLYHRFFINMNPLKEFTAKTVLKCTGNYEEMIGLFMSETDDPDCAQSIQTLETLYQQALQEAPEVMTQVLSEGSCAHLDRFAHTFNEAR